MSAPRCTRRLARKHFTLETLERRELMAVDALSAVTLDVAGFSRATSVTSVSAQNTTARTNGSASSIPTPAASILANPRAYDGTGNNVANPEWGSVGEQLLRAAENDYADGVSSLAGEDRPGARVISNKIAAIDEETPLNERGLSAYVYVWGQFLDHDMDLTESSITNPERVPIGAPIGDLQFDPDGTGIQVIPFTRSVFDPTTGTSIDNPRQQINEVTSWIDGSMIYGSSAETAARLRTFSGGRMLTSDGALPPQDEQGFIGGDIRANENIELTSMHALFLREHNLWAAKISRENPRLNDEQVFQRARAIVIAEVQAITYNEFLPALLGRGALDRYTGYASTVDPAIANEFSTAAFRLHTLINDDVEFFGNDGRAVRDEVELRDAFNNPALLEETGIDGILKYAASSNAQEVDNQIVDGLRNFLFGQPGQGGLDLAALNIQRGRDHGLADYNTVREAYGLGRVTSFAEITSDVEVQQKLQALYGTVDNIDLWVGLLAEDHVAGSSLGETSRTILSDQFERLRDGDRYWYQNIFTGRQLAQLDQTTLADVIRRNTTVTNLQDNVFFMRAEASGQVFSDRNGNGRQDRREGAVAGATVELLDDEGSVIATAVTNQSGRYRFDDFHETGDFRIRVTAPAGQVATTVAERAILISRGGVSLSNINFGVRAGRGAAASAVVESLEANQTASLDAAFASSGAADAASPLAARRRLRR